MSMRKPPDLLPRPHITKQPDGMWLAEVTLLSRGWFSTVETLYRSRDARPDIAYLRLASAIIRFHRF